MVKPTDCNGIPEKEDGSDEDFKKCKSHFPPSATVPCFKKDMGNKMSIKILAIPCNNKAECEKNEDEENCNQGTAPVATSLGIGLIVTLVVAGIVIVRTKLNLAKELNVSEDQPVSISKQVQLQQCQPEERRKWNQKYFQALIGSNGGKRDEALNKIRLQFGPSITENFINDIQEDKEDNQSEELSFVDKVLSFLNSIKEKVLKIFKR